MLLLESLVSSCRFEDGRIVGIERDGAAEQAGVRAGWVTNLFTYSIFIYIFLEFGIMIHSL